MRNKDTPLCYHQDDFIIAVAKLFQKRRSKIFLNSCYYKPSLKLKLKHPDEALQEVRELLSCSNEYAKSILILLQCSGKHIPLCTVYLENKQEDTDDDLDIDEDDSFTYARKVTAVPVKTKIVYSLTHHGILRQEFKIYLTGELPTNKVTHVSAEQVLGIAHNYNSTSLTQLRLMTHLYIFTVIEIG